MKWTFIYRTDNYVVQQALDPVRRYVVLRVSHCIWCEEGVRNLAPTPFGGDRVDFGRLFAWRLRRARATAAARARQYQCELAAARRAVRWRGYIGHHSE